MKLSKCLYPEAYLAPKHFQTSRTSKLLETGLFVKFYAPGIPFYLPIGKMIVDKIIAVIQKAVGAAEMTWIDLPLALNNQILAEGEPIPATFARKFIYLQDRLANYHLLSTPEMLLVHMAKQGLFSHHQLPIRYSYIADFLRQIHDPKGILKSKQFKMFGGISLEKDMASCLTSLTLFKEVTADLFARFNMHTIITHYNADKYYYEFFYPCKEGDVWHDAATLGKTKVLSLAMTYVYANQIKLPARFRTNHNLNQSVKVTTYGLGLQRLFYALLDQSRDQWGFNLSADLRPYDHTIIPRSSKDLVLAEKMYADLKQQKKHVTLDDRLKKSTQTRKCFADFIGVPTSTIIDNNIIRTLPRGTPFI